jgi:hypothetical protein
MHPVGCGAKKIKRGFDPNEWPENGAGFEGVTSRVNADDECHIAPESAVTFCFPYHNLTYGLVAFALISP